MKLILGVDAIFPPLTGIGRYAWELASRLGARHDIDALRFFSMGRWVDHPASLLASPAGPVPMRRNLAVQARRWLARQPLGVAAYSALMPHVFRSRLRPFKSHLFHSPNYFIPPVSGLAVATVHDLSNYKFPETHPVARRKYFDKEFPLTLKRATHLITDSEATRSEVSAYFGWPLERITAIPLGADSRFRPMTAAETGATLARYRLRGDGYALCVSTIEPRKNIDKLLCAYEALPDALKGAFPLVLVGGRGWLSDAVHARIERGVSKGWLIYPGYVDDADLPVLYAGARAFLFLSAYEGFGLPVLEAMAAGVPVVTSNCSSLPEVAGGAALLVEPDDLDGVRDAISAALLDDGWRMRAQADGLARAKFLTWERCVEQTVELYRRVSG